MSAVHERVLLDRLERGEKVSIPALGVEGRVIDVLGTHFDAVGVIVLDGSRRIRLALDRDADGDRDVIRVEEWKRGTYRDRIVCEHLERRDGRVVVPEGESGLQDYNGRRAGVSGA